MKRRIRQRNTLPGALWHIFHNEDKNKIRDFLNKVALEKGMRLDPHDDPIHDQSTYLDAKLRRRLYQEYGVRGKLMSKTSYILTLLKVIKSRKQFFLKFLCPKNESLDFKKKCF